VTTATGTLMGLFQSRSGFFPRLDPIAGLMIGSESLVSIPLWVSSPSRHATCKCNGRHGAVSIPLWVSSPSRPFVATELVSHWTVSIPLWVFSPSRLSRPVGGRLQLPRFNPALGFFPVSTASIMSPQVTV